MSDEPDKNRSEEAPESAEPSDDTAAESADVQEDPGTRVSSEDSADPSADADSAEAEGEPVQAEAEQEAPEAEADAEEPEADAEEAEAEEPVAEEDDDEDEAEEDEGEEPAAAADDDEDDEEDEDDDGEGAEGAAPARTRPSRSRRRGERDPDLPPPVVRAQARYVRSSARKARLVCDQFRGRSVEDARAILAVTPRAIARDWSKLLESAVANAEHNHELVGEDLYIKSVQADEGPTIKRFQPRAKGRATRIRKRTSHLTILLTPKD
jgi:ribosomal protein L22